MSSMADEKLDDSLILYYKWFILSFWKLIEISFYPGSWGILQAITTCVLFPSIPAWSSLSPFLLFIFVLFCFFFLSTSFLYFNWRLITLQYCSGFCHTFTRISHWCTCVPHPEPFSHLPPHPIPQGHPSAPALSTLSHVSYLDLQSISHMIIHMFQCYSLKLSHPHLLPQSPKACFYFCVSFAVSHIGSSLPSF